MSNRSKWLPLLLPAGEVTGRALAFVAFVIVARSSSTQTLADYAILLSLLAIWTVSVTLGIDTWGTRQIVIGGGSRANVIAQVQSARWLLYALTTVPIIAVALLLVGADEWVAVAWTTFAALAATVNQSWAAVGAGQPWVVGVARANARLGLLIATVAFAATGMSTSKAMVATAISMWLESLIVLLWQRSKPRTSWLPGKQSLATAFRRTGYFSITSIGSSIYHNLDQLLLGWLSAPAAVAAYGIAYRSYTSVGGVPSLVVDAYWSRMPARHRDLSNILARPLTWVAAALVGALASTAAFFALPWVFNVEDAAIPAALLFFGVGFTGITALGTRLLWNQQEERKVALIMLLALALNAMLNILAIPRYGAVGAAAICLLTDLLSALVVTLAVVKTPKRGA